jgi:tetratricopeptide (TPR) repeat protein
MTALLPACSVFAEYPTRDIHVRSELPATTTAWLIADILRKEIPAGDDLPMHACPPVQRTGDDSYTVWYIGDEGDGLRVLRNGRISPPDSSSGPLVGCRFIPSRKLTGNRASAREEVRIEIHGGGAAGCAIRMRLEGSPAENGLSNRVIAALRTGTEVFHATRWIERGAFDRAEVRAATTLREWNSNATAHHRCITARLHYVRARVDLARSDFAAARAHLRQALRADPGLVVARRALARTCASLADRAGVLSHSRGRVKVPAEHDAAKLARGATELLEIGEITAASHWAQKALDRDPRSREVLRLLAATFAAGGKHQRTLETQLLTLERFGFDASLVLSVAQRCASLGDVMTGARVLSRYREQLEIAEPRRAQKLMRRLCRNIPSGQAYRLLQRSGSTLADEFRQDAGPACVELFSKLSDLRRSHGDVPAFAPRLTGQLAMDGYRMAPGVGPAR